MKKRLFLLLSALVVISLALAACAGGAEEEAPAEEEPAEEEAEEEMAEEESAEEEMAEEEAEAPAEEMLDVVLINNFMGNTWRPLMERSLQLAVGEAPLNERVNPVRFINTENDATAQNAAIQTVILDEPDIILLLSASPTALNQSLQEACDAGIVVVTFDTIAEAPCAWKLALDFAEQGDVSARWMADAIGEEGTVFMDLGLEGVAPAIAWADAAMAALEEYPDVEVITYFGGFSPGEEQAQVATLAAANPDVDGILGFAYGNYAADALGQAGVSGVPTTGFAYSEAMSHFAETGTPALLWSSPAWISIEALYLALEVIDGERSGEPEFVLLSAPVFVNNDFNLPTERPVLDLDEYAVDLEPGLQLPLSPPYLELDREAVLQPPVIDE